MDPVSAVIDLFELLLFLATQAWGGSVGAGLLSFSVLIRLALLPVSYRLAVRMRTNQRLLATLRPRIARIQSRYADDPVEGSRALRRLLDANGVSLSGGLFKGMLLQTPIWMTAYAVVRRSLTGVLGSGFLWVRSLADPSVGLALLAGVVVGGAAVAGTDPQAGSPGWAHLLPAVLSVAVLAFLPSAYALFAIGSGAVGVVQGGLVRLRDRYGS